MAAGTSLEYGAYDPASRRNPDRMEFTGGDFDQVDRAPPLYGKPQNGGDGNISYEMSRPWITLGSSSEWFRKIADR